ncbi:hypothetical protein BT96DRAFT_994714 [Gymnopus androsaceus JB14]|uniref:Uncharacterized protein n=1 Tax=Gymnopus androsaceus JB14 TaxID=1447944 RepID=A0A6A4HJD8_9AGAR|nr:hypothetical protein BT96DRAFT_994714 [Gymnopus androsaceus JB14]
MANTSSPDITLAYHTQCLELLTKYKHIVHKLSTPTEGRLTDLVVAPFVDSLEGILTRDIPILKAAFTRAIKPFPTERKTVDYRAKYNPPNGVDPSFYLELQNLQRDIQNLEGISRQMGSTVELEILKRLMDELEDSLLIHVPRLQAAIGRTALTVEAFNDIYGVPNPDIPPIVKEEDHDVNIPAAVEEEDEEEVVRALTEVKDEPLDNDSTVHALTEVKDEEVDRLDDNLMDVDLEYRQVVVDYRAGLLHLLR